LNWLKEYHLVDATEEIFAGCHRSSRRCTPYNDYYQQSLGQSISLVEARFFGVVC
jgi:hypothetical protein